MSILFGVSRHHVLECADKRSHLGFLADRQPHVVWISREQAADGDVLVFHRFDDRHDRFQLVDAGSTGFRFTLTAAL
jgi:hypothetical protein